MRLTFYIDPAAFPAWLNGDMVIIQRPARPKTAQIALSVLPREVEVEHKHKQYTTYVRNCDAEPVLEFYIAAQSYPDWSSGKPVRLVSVDSGALVKINVQDQSTIEVTQDFSIMDGCNVTCVRNLCAGER